MLDGDLLSSLGPRDALVVHAPSGARDIDGLYRNLVGDPDWAARVVRGGAQGGALGDAAPEPLSCVNGKRILPTRIIGMPLTPAAVRGLPGAWAGARGVAAAPEWAVRLDGAALGCVDGHESAC